MVSLFFRTPGNIRILEQGHPILDPTQCESDRKKARTASACGSVQCSLNLPPPLEGSPPSPTLPVTPCYGLLICVLTLTSAPLSSWLVQLVIWPGILPGSCSKRWPLSSPSSTYLPHTTVIQYFTLTLITGCLHKQNNYHQIQKLNSLDDAACTVVIDGFMN